MMLKLTLSLHMKVLRLIKAHPLDFLIFNILFPLYFQISSLVPILPKPRGPYSNVKQSFSLYFVELTLNLFVEIFLRRRFSTDQKKFSLNERSSTHSEIRKHVDTEQAYYLLSQIYRVPEQFLIHDSWSQLIKLVRPNEK